MTYIGIMTAIAATCIYTSWALVVALVVRTLVNGL